MSNNDISTEDKALFRQAVSGVEPLSQPQKVSKRREKVPSLSRPAVKQISSSHNKIDESYLSDYIRESIFDNSVLSYQSSPLPLKRFKQLQKGEIPIQGKLDLHGFRSDEAKHKLISYLSLAKEQGKRCILVIHGKGSHHGEAPRIKNLVNVWLPQISTVIAFHSAIAKDGGTGALYVLLKR